jgi:hypothetical protein
MHTKKRNKRLDDLVFVSYNRKMISRFQKRREKEGPSYDPLVIEDFDWANEWIDSSVVPVGIMMILLTSHGIMLMKPLEHQTRFEVATFQDKLIT